MPEYPLHTVVWEVTWKCNASCIHCGSDCISVEKQNQLTTKECIEIINDLAKIGAKKIVLSGGDPFLRSDLPVLAFAIKERGMGVAFITNAIALDDDKIAMLSEVKPCAFGISIDAGEAWMHDYIRGHNGCFDHAMESIIKLKENGVEPSIITTTHKLNFSQLPKMRDLFIKMGIRAWQIQYADLIGRMQPEAMITEAQFKKQAEFVLETQNLIGEEMFVTGADVTGYMTELSSKIGMGNWNGCHAGIQALGLGSDGTVRGCLSQQLDKYIEGNIRQNSLYEIWNNPNSFKYNRCFDINTLGGYCRECEYAEICKGGCTRAATKNSDCRCSNFCLHRFDKIGYSNEYQSKTYFSKEEIEKIYSPTKALPKEFYDSFEPLEDILGHC